MRPTYDERQVGEERVSSVQYLKFEVDESRPGGDRLRPRPDLHHETELTEAQRGVEKDLDE